VSIWTFPFFSNTTVKKSIEETKGSFSVGITVLSVAKMVLALPYTQGVSRLVDSTAGGDFPGLCNQKSLYEYKHVSYFGRLRRYGHFLIPVHALVWTASYGTSWRVMYSTWWLIVCGSCNEKLAQFTTERQHVLRPAVAFLKTSFKHRPVQIKGNFTKLTLHLYFKCIMYYACLLFCSVYCQ